MPRFWLTKITESEKESLNRAEEDMAECKGRILEIEKQQDRAILDKAKAILDHFNQIGGIRKAGQALLEAQILLMEAESEVGILVAKNSVITQQLEDEKKALDEIVQELNEQRAIAAEARGAAIAILTEENQTVLGEQARDKTVEDIDQSIQVCLLYTSPSPRDS